MGQAVVIRIIGIGLGLQYRLIYKSEKKKLYVLVIDITPPE